MAFDDRLHEDDAPETGEQAAALQSAAQPAARPAAQPVAQSAAVGWQAAGTAAGAASNIAAGAAFGVGGGKEAAGVDAGTGGSPETIVSTSAAPEAVGADASCAADLVPVSEEPATPAVAANSAGSDTAGVAAHDEVLIQAADALLTQTPAPFDDAASAALGASAAPDAAVQPDAAQPVPFAPEPAFMPDAGQLAAAAAPIPGKHRHHILRALAIVVGVLVVAFTACVVALAVSDVDRVAHVPANTSIDGDVDISGLTSDALRQTIEGRFSDGQSKRVSIDFDGDIREIELQDVGEVDVDAMVDAAFSPYAVPIVDRMIDHVGEIFGDEQPVRSVATTVKPVAEKVRLAVEAIAADYDCYVRDAAWEFSDEENKPVVVPAQDGRHIDVEATVAAVQKDITNTAETGEVDGVVTAEKAQNTTVGQAIYVDTSACVLHFYENGVETHTYDCTPGKSGYTTPHGDWTLSYKDAAPTWYNPHSSWSANMPETIAPGASNPLGLRALALSCGGGIFIHGTTNKSQLGTRASHGCIRLSNDNIVELYNIVETGIPIYVR